MNQQPDSFTKITSHSLLGLSILSVIKEKKLLTTDTDEISKIEKQLKEKRLALFPVFHQKDVNYTMKKQELSETVSTILTHISLTLCESHSSYSKEELILKLDLNDESKNYKPLLSLLCEIMEATDRKGYFFNQNFFDRINEIKHGEFLDSSRRELFHEMNEVAELKKSSLSRD